MAEASTAELLAGYLCAAGVRHIFGYPGESVIDFMEAARQHDLRVVSAVREATAAFMAEGAAMATGGPAVCLSTLGPGSTAVLNGVASAAHRGRLRAAWQAGLAEGRLNPSDVVAISREAAAADAIMTTDVGSHKLMAGQVWSAGPPRSVLMTNGLSAMGFGVPAAIAARLCFPERPVIALVGDGGFAMTATELQIAAELGLPVTVVVFADGSLNRIELRQQLMGYPPTATRLGGTDLPALAEAMGCDGIRVDTPASLDKVLSDLGTRSAGTRPLVVEARIDPSEYEAQF